jgi:hypothetical protein
MEARKFDSMFCPEKDRDREKAAKLYAEAIAAQPGARGNARWQTGLLRCMPLMATRQRDCGLIQSRRRSGGCFAWT